MAHQLAAGQIASCLDNLLVGKHNVSGPPRFRPPPPCASTAAVPKVRSKRRFNAHPVLRQGRACARHT